MFSQKIIDPEQTCAGPFNISISLENLCQHRIAAIGAPQKVRGFDAVKNFSGIYVGYDDAPKIKTYSMYVRNDTHVITDIVPGMDELFDAGIIKAAPVGEAMVHYCPASDFFDQMSVIVREHPEKLHKIKPPKF